MYLRYTTRKKDGKVHRYWRLVRSVRVGRRVIHRFPRPRGQNHGEAYDPHGCGDCRSDLFDPTHVAWLLDRALESPGLAIR